MFKKENNEVAEIRKKIFKTAAKASGHEDHSYLVYNPPMEKEPCKTSMLMVNCEDDASIIVKGIIRRSGFEAVINNPPIMSNEFEGHSKVNFVAGDTYDAEIGKELACKRVLNKYHKELNTKLLRFLSDVRNLCAYTEHYLDKRGVNYEKVMSVENMKHVRYEQTNAKNKQ